MSWPLVKLSEICEIHIGKTPARANPRYWGKGYPWLSIADMNQGRDLLDTKEQITDLAVSETNIKRVPKGTVLFSFKLSIGKVGIAKRDLYTNEAIAAFHVKDCSRLSSEYLFHALTSVDSGKSSDRAVMGATLNKKKLSELEIPLPPLAEQKRIAAILDKADALRRKRQQAIELADQFLRSVFLDMFGDPVTNPKGFAVCTLKEFYCDQKQGTKCGPFGSALKKEEYQSDGVPVWNMDNISLLGEFKDSPSLWVTPEKYEELESYSVQSGDVIISRAGTVGKMGVVRTRYSQSLISTNLIRVRFGPRLMPEYFVALMTYCKGRVGRLKVGTDGSFTHMNTGILDSIEFPYPPLEVQKEYLKVMDQVLAGLASQVTAKNELDCLFASMSRQAFSGEL